MSVLTKLKLTVKHQGTDDCLLDRCVICYYRDIVSSMKQFSVSVLVAGELNQSVRESASMLA